MIKSADELELDRIETVLAATSDPHLRSIIETRIAGLIAKLKERPRPPPLPKEWPSRT